MESEYIALSMATRELLQLHRILQEIHCNSLITLPLENIMNITRTTTFNDQIKQGFIKIVKNSYQL
jgi:hypothetical protein